MIQTGKKYGMTLLDDSIMDLFKRGIISAEDAYAKSNDKARFRPVHVRDDEDSRSMDGRLG